MRFCNMCNDNFQNHGKVIALGKKPSSFALGDYVAKVVVQDINDLIICNLEMFFGVEHFVSNLSSSWLLFLTDPWSLDET
jgi:hypothetical protein